MPKKTVEPHLTPDGRWCLIIPANLAGGKRKRKWFGGKGAEAAARRFAEGVETSRRAKIDNYESLNLVQRVTVGAEIARLPNGIADLRAAVDNYLAHCIGETKLLGEAIRDCLASKKAAGLSAKYLSQFRSSLRQFELSFGKRECHAISAESHENNHYNR